jgi:hypothetical protein
MACDLGRLEEIMATIVSNTGVPVWSVEYYLEDAKAARDHKRRLRMRRHLDAAMRCCSRHFLLQGDAETPLKLFGKRRWLNRLLWDFGFEGRCWGLNGLAARHPAIRDLMKAVKLLPARVEHDEIPGRAVLAA